MLDKLWKMIGSFMREDFCEFIEQSGAATRHQPRIKQACTSSFTKASHSMSAQAGNKASLNHGPMIFHGKHVLDGLYILHIWQEPMMVAITDIRYLDNPQGLHAKLAHGQYLYIWNSTRPSTGRRASRSSSDNRYFFRI